MKVLLTQEIEDRDPQTPIAILDLAAYGRQCGHDVTVGYHDDMAALDGYDWIGFSALVLGQRTLDSLLRLTERTTCEVRLGGKATECILPRDRQVLREKGIIVSSGAGEVFFLDVEVTYGDYPPWSLADFRTLDKFGRMDMMMASRGCPYHCHFCHNTEKRVNYFSPERTVANAAILLDDMGRNRVFFVDDIFALRPDKMMAILAEADRTGLELRKRTAFFVHMSQIDDRRLDAIDAFQPQELQTGIESGDDRMLKAMGKTFDAVEAETNLRLLHSHGQHVACLFLMGFPGETVESLANTVAFVQRNRQYMSGWWVSYFQPVPGTIGYDMAIERDPTLVVGGWNTEISYVDPNITRYDLEQARAAVMQ